MDNKELWQTALGEIEVSVSKPNFITWFKDTTITSNKDGIVVISVPNNFIKEWLEKKYNKFILKALRKISRSIKELRYEVNTSSIPKDASLRRKRKKQSFVSPLAESQLDLEDVVIDKETNLNSRYTFDSFVIGSSNELAHAAAICVTKNLGKIYNPLFIYGGVGLGKTHLIQAIGNEVVSRKGKRKPLKVKYVHSEKFTNELVKAIQHKKTEDFKEFYRKTDVLIVDDVQFLAGKEKTQEEFFHTFNELYENNKQIILSSDRPPKAISTIEERLRSRFEGGMTADIGYPDLETRLAILIKKTEEKDFAIPEEILNYIATNIQKNIRELEGALNKIIAVSQINNTPLTLPMAKEVLAGIISAPKRKVTPRQIIKAVAEFYDVKEKELTNRGRKKEVVRPRQIAMYLMREEIDSSYPSIGEKLGGRDHTTAMYACERIERKIENDESIRLELNLIRERLYNQ